MFQTINGYTKESMKDVIRKEFKGRAIENGCCKYLTSDGKKCAIGCFIPDGHTAQFSGISVSHLLDIYPDLCLPLNNEGLQELQQFHDLRSLELTTDNILEWIDNNVI